MSCFLFQAKDDHMEGEDADGQGGTGRGMGGGGGRGRGNRFRSGGGSGGAREEWGLRNQDVSILLLSVWQFYFPCGKGKYQIFDVTKIEIRKYARMLAKFCN